MIIPTHNRQDRLRDAIESVRDQTYDPLEILIVDDGSTPPAMSELPEEQLSDERLTVFRHADNRGANAARNTGIRAARGTFLAFLDDDDRWLPTKLAAQVSAFRSADPRVGVVYAGRRSHSPHGVTETAPTTSGNVVKPLLTGTSFGQFSSLMVKARVLDRAGLPDERFPAWQDREWLFRLARVSHFEAIPRVLTIRRTDLPDSITHSYEAKRDVAYPLFIEKHYPFARQYGRYYARAFLASLRMILARTAVRVGRYAEGRRYFLLALLANPLDRSFYPHAIASLGGEPTYTAASRIRTKLLDVQDRYGGR